MSMKTCAISMSDKSNSFFWKFANNKDTKSGNIGYRISWFNEEAYSDHIVVSVEHFNGSKKQSIDYAALNEYFLETIKVEDCLVISMYHDVANGEMIFTFCEYEEEKGQC